eukprot:s158_g1.t1
MEELSRLVRSLESSTDQDGPLGGRGRLG